jgi:hypothetical protein
MRATKLMFAHKQLMTQDVLAVALQRMLDMSPIPPLFMRTVIQSVQLCPSLKHKIMEILKSLITKKVSFLFFLMAMCVSRTHCALHSNSILIQTSYLL